MLAGFLSLLCFRIFNPYAFNGPGFFGLSLDQRWLDNIGAAQAMNAGIYDNPPNFQWVARLPYLFPLNNMVLWGMGLAAWHHGLDQLAVGGNSHRARQSRRRCRT